MEGMFLLFFKVKTKHFVSQLETTTLIPDLSYYVFDPFRGRRQRPELCGVLLSAAHAGPSLPKPRWLSEFGTEGVGDGWPSLLGPLQPLKEE